jgi:hypothetical protein
VGVVGDDAVAISDVFAYVNCQPQGETHSTIQLYPELDEIQYER